MSNRDLPKPTQQAYKILKTNSDYTLCLAEQTASGEIILEFTAASYEQAMLIRNQFLQFSPYQPFGQFWLAKVGHVITINGVVKNRYNYEERWLIVLADHQPEATAKVTAEATAYSEPYDNCYGQPVTWQFDKILDLQAIDFFRTSDLYAGVPVEIYSKRISKRFKRPTPD
jgi:hypothetical protein